MYYNKDAFAEVGLTPEKPPLTWEQLISVAQRVTRREGPGTSRWGLAMPLDAWYYHALVFANGAQELNADGSRVLWDQPKNLEALKFWHELVNKHAVTSADPAANNLQQVATGKVAMIWETTASQPFLRQNVNFRWSIGRIPKHTEFAPPSGGGNLMLHATDPDRRKAAWTFITWMSEPAQAARWGVAIGYIATNIAAWDRPEMQALFQEHPEVLVTREQVRDAEAQPASPKYATARAILNALIRDVLANKAPLEAATRQAVANANAAMAR
jgi:sn-glycerol 3-phosphate transport system substrate-binding protein